MSRSMELGAVPRAWWGISGRDVCGGVACGEILKLKIPLLHPSSSCRSSSSWPAIGTICCFPERFILSLGNLAAVDYGI